MMQFYRTRSLLYLSRDNKILFLDQIYIQNDLLKFSSGTSYFINYLCMYISLYKLNLLIMEARKLSNVYIWGMFNDKQYPTPTKVKELQNKQVVSIASGGFFYIVATAKGQMYGWGKTKHSRFGIAEVENILIPKSIPCKVPIVKVAAGNWHSMAIDNTGAVYAVGHNKTGACGLGHFQNVDNMSPIKIPLNCKQISLGDCFSLMLTTNNELYTCGHTQFNGHSKKQHLNTPVIIPFKQKIVAIAAGFTHSLAASYQNTFSWGKGQFFQLGHGNKNDQKEPKIIKRLQGIKIIQLACTRGQKNAHSMAVSADGKLFTWGAGYKGKLGHQKYWSHQDQADQFQPKEVQKIDKNSKISAAGGIHSIVLNNNGELYSFGCGSNGRLGHIQSIEHKYLYREGYPRMLDTLQQIFIVDVKASYYHNICLGTNIKQK